MHWVARRRFERVLPAVVEVVAMNRYQPSLLCSFLFMLEASLRAIGWCAFCYDRFDCEISISICLSWENVCVS